MATAVPCLFPLSGTGNTRERCSSPITRKGAHMSPSASSVPEHTPAVQVSIPSTSALSDMTTLQVRSHRRAQWFWIDNAVIDTYGPTLGPIGLSLYMGLCRYANSSTGKCWPSLGKLSQQLGISVISASRHLKTLVACGLLQVEPRPGTTALVTILDIPESPITEIGVDPDPHPPEGTPPSQRWGSPITEMGEPDLRNQTKELPPYPPESAHAVHEEITPLAVPLHVTIAALLTVWDDTTRTQLEAEARTTLAAEGVSPWHLIKPAVEARMVTLWEAQTQDRGAPGGETVRQEYAA